MTFEPFHRGADIDIEEKILTEDTHTCYIYIYMCVCVCVCMCVYVCVCFPGINGKICHFSLVRRLIGRSSPITYLHQSRHCHPESGVGDFFNSLGASGKMHVENSSY